MAEGPKVGGAHVTIEPDVDEAAFVRAGRAAGSIVDSSISDRLSAASASLGRLASQLSGVGNGISSIGFSMSAFITGPVALAGGAIAAFGLSAAMNLEKTRATLASLLPVGYDVQGLLTRLQTIATNSPVFDTNLITKYAASFTAAGLEIGKTERFLQAFGNVAASMGGDTQAVDRSLYAIAQSFGNGKVQADEFRRQLGEALPGATKIVTEAMGLTTEQFNKMMEAGEITGDMLIDAFIKAGESSRFLTGAAAASNTLSGQLHMLQESAQATLGQAFLNNFGAIKTSLAQLQPLLNDILASFIQALPTIIGWFTQLVQKAIDLKAVYDGLTPQQKEWVQNILLLLVAAGPALLIIGKALTGIGMAIQVISLLLNPWGAVFAVIAAALAGLAILFINLYKNSEDFRGAIQDAIRWFKEEALPAIKEFWGWLQDKAEPILRILADGFEKHVLPAAKELWKAIKEDLWPAIQKLIDTIGSENIEKFINWITHSIPYGFGLFLAALKLVIQFVSLLIEGVAFIIEGFKELERNLDKFTEIVKNSLKDARDEWNSFLDLGPKVWNAIVDTAQDAWNKIQGFFGGIGDWFRQKFDEVKFWITDIMGNAAGAVKDVWNRISDSFKNDFVNKIIDGLNVIIRGFNRMVGLIPGVSNSLIPEVPHWAQGGLVTGPGTGTSDSVPSMLSRGEYVIPASIVRKLGTGFFDEIRAGRLPSVAPIRLGPMSGSFSDIGAKEITVVIHNELDGEIITRRAQAVVDKNNEATISVLRSGRRLG